MENVSKNKYKDYFNSIAQKRKKRVVSRYYWKEISDYCAYYAHEDASILEVGCGSGDLLASISGSKKTGIDFSEEYISWAKEKHSDKGIDFVLMDANNIQLNQTYDLVLISNLIGFVDDIQNVFEQIKKCCHPNTKIIVQYYNSFWEPVIKFAEVIGLKQRTPWQNWLSTRDIKFIVCFGV